MKVLSGHYSADTAFVVADYPYGFRLRCKIRYWLEVNSKGTRFWSQTTNPKKPIEVWNAPKASTYSLVGVMCQKEASDGKPEEDGHICWVGMSAYDVSKCADYLAKYRAGMTEGQINLVEALAKGHAALEARRAASNPISPIASTTP